jgi:poly(A) polymerase
MRTPFAIPFSPSKPSKSEISLNAKFEKYLDTIEPLASASELKAREDVIKEIQKIINKWVNEVSIKQGYTGEALKAACGKVFTFGSYRLGLITPSADIDALCVAPKHISREDFFGSLQSILEANPQVSDLSGVPDAVVPIIKMKYNKIEVDLTFARLNLGVIDSKLESLKSDNLLKHLDEKTVRSINGTRVADALLSLVPRQETFITVLRFIRHWAKKRGLYSNAMGYFGGITWAILSARVCQMYPNFTPLKICQKFFVVYSRWNWSNPVTLCPITQSAEVGLMGFKIWNPKINASDRHHLMPIITPAFPCMNSTYNVTETTRRVLLSEFARGNEVLIAFEEQEANEKILDKLVQSPRFLSLFNYFVVVQIESSSEPVLNKLKGFVESRIRMLLKFLESPVSGVQRARPWPKEFAVSEKNNSKYCWLVGLSFGAVKNGAADLRPAIAQFHEKINEWSEKEAEAGKYSVSLFHVGRKAELIRAIAQNEKELYDAQVSTYLDRQNRELLAGDAAAKSWSLAEDPSLQSGARKRKKQLSELQVQLEDVV